MAQMDFMMWDFLSRDVSFCCGLQSPMLSWIGSAAIVLFSLWQVGTLWRETSSSRRPFDRLRPTLHALAQSRKHLQPERLSAKVLMRAKDQRRNPSPVAEHRDCDDLEALDAAIQQEGLFRHTWRQFRKTLLIEHPSWFVEPKIYSSRPAEEFFTHDALFSSRVNLSWYSQLPSLITGIGLLLTFLALFVGLSKLHAEGQNIEGIQGLINGLAGKFLTSIVGLLCANAFSLIEKPVVFRLMNAQQEFIDLLNDLFPRKTMEQMLEDLTSQQKSHAGNQPDFGASAIDRFRTTMANSLGEPVAALTSTVQSLIRSKEGDRTDARQRLVTDVRQAVQAGLAPPLKELKEVMLDLAKTLKGMHATHQADEANIDRLVVRLTDALDSRLRERATSPSMKLVYGHGALAVKGTGKIERNLPEREPASAQVAG
ncbi:MAG: hypothetical protein ACREJU_16695 [Nitrospiraceae bacterium]